MLADMERVMVGQGRWVLATDDVRRAFDNIIIDDVMADYRRHVAGTELIALIEATVRGSEGKQVGLDQGSGLSPLSMNLRLHYLHDLAFQGHVPPTYRYADNVVYVCVDEAEGIQALDRAAQLLGEAGLALKGEDGPPKDLRRGEAVQLLGFTITRRGDGLHLGLGENAWAKLRQGLEKAHQAENPSDRARKVVVGWLNAYGPAFESKRMSLRFPKRVLRTTAQLGFREVDTPLGLQGRCLTAWDNWLAFRKKAASQGTTGKGAGG
jgi:hypothetical protein